MQVIGGPTFNPTAGTPFDINTSISAHGGQVVLHNLSPYDLTVTFNHDPTRNALLFAWQPKKFDFKGHETETITVAIYASPSPAYVNNAPSNYVVGEAYAPGEPVPAVYPNYDRLSNVGNTVSTTGSSQTLQNDGNAPPLQVIEMTPSDQASSSVKIDNDSSGFFKVLSAGILRTVLNIVRGNSGATKAAIDIGDSGDLSIATFHGTLDAGVTIAGSQVTGDVAVGQVGPGALDSDVTIAGSQVTGDVAASQVGPGALDTDVTIIGAQVVSGTVPDASTADLADAVAYNSASTTTPQLQTGTANAGVAAKDNKASGFVEIFPTMNDATARGIQFDYQDAAGALHGGFVLKPSGSLQDTGGRIFNTNTSFSGTGAGTFSHGLGLTPNWVGITENVLNSTETVGVDTIGSTTVHVDVGVGGTAWIGIAHA